MPEKRKRTPTPAPRRQSARIKGRPQPPPVNTPKRARVSPVLAPDSNPELGKRKRTPAPAPRRQSARTAGRPQPPRVNTIVSSTPTPDSKTPQNILDDGAEPSIIYGMSHIIALQIVGKEEVRTALNIKRRKLKSDYPKYADFINLVRAVQKVLDLMLQTSKANISGNPASVNNRSLEGDINLKNITNVYAYLARKMGDLIHDLQSVKLLKAKLGISESSDIVVTFKKYINAVKWLNPEIRVLIKNASPGDKVIFEQIHGALDESIGRADKISESKMNATFSKILMRGRTDVPYITTSITNIESIRTFQPVPSIVFDQTSKGIGPNFYGQLIRTFPNNIVTQNLGLATFADFAGSLPSSPERGYMYDMAKIISKFSTIKKKEVWEILNKYSLNVSPTFVSRVRMGNVEVQTTRLLISVSNQIRRQLILGGRVVNDGIPLSADSAKLAVITECEHKTGLDFDLIVFAKALGAIHTTGDVSACGFNQDLAIMGVHNNFVNETTSMVATVGIGTGQIETKAPVNMPVETRPDAFVVKMLTNEFGQYGFTPENVQKLSNAFRVGNGVSNAKRQHLINKFRNTKVQGGTIKRIVNSSKTAYDLRSKLEKNGYFDNMPDGVGRTMEEGPLENKTTLNIFRASLQSKGINNARINSLYTVLNTPNLRSQVMNSRSPVLISILRNKNVSKQNLTDYLNLVQNKRARNLASSRRQQPATNPKNINEFINKFPRLKEGYTGSEERVRTDIRKLIKTNINRGKKNNGGIERHVLDYINFNKEIQRVANQSIVKNKYISLTPEEKLQLYLNIGRGFSNLRYSTNDNTPEGNINNKRKEILRRYISKNS